MINPGDRFSRLIVISDTGTRTSNGGKVWLCRCDCGVEKRVRAGGLRNGDNVSCGCYAAEQSRKRMTTHGMWGTREYHSWNSMKNRCTLKTNGEYHNYGGRGITVCKRWMDSFSDFFTDMGPCPMGFTIERVNNDLGYSKANCIWASHKTQCNNHRRNRMLRFNGKEMNLSQWAELIGIGHLTLRSRLNRGWSVEKALATPLSSQGRRPDSRVKGNGRHISDVFKNISK